MSKHVSRMDLAKILAKTTKNVGMEGFAMQIIQNNLNIVLLPVPMIPIVTKSNIVFIISIPVLKNVAKLGVLLDGHVTRTMVRLVSCTILTFGKIYYYYFLQKKPGMCNLLF